MTRNAIRLTKVAALAVIRDMHPNAVILELESHLRREIGLGLCLVRPVDD